MATNFYADRGYLTVNGVVMTNLKSVKWTVDESVTRVDTMTANHTSSGWKKGNKKVTGSMELEVEDEKAAVDLSFQYGNDISVIAQIGNQAERWTLVGLVQTTQDFNGSVGEAGKTINFEARDAVNESGPAVNSDIGF